MVVSWWTVFFFFFFFFFFFSQCTLFTLIALQGNTVNKKHSGKYVITNISVRLTLIVSLPYIMMRLVTHLYCE